VHRFKVLQFALCKEGLLNW